MRHRTAPLAPIAAAVAALTFLFASAAPAFAVSAPTPPASTSFRAGTPISPSGCYQNADNPHFSKHDHDVLAKTWTKCRQPVPRISQTVQLWETRWWGWDRVGTKVSHTDYWYEYSAAFAHLSCRHSTIRSTNSGTVVDVDGDTYDASTESSHIDNPCNL